MLNFEEICRVCMRREQELLSIFDEKPTENLISTMLTECTKYKVFRHDGLPQHICSECSNTVKEAYQFKQNCEKSYRQLIQLAKSKLVDQDNKIYLEDSQYTMESDLVDKGTQTEASAIHSCAHCHQRFFKIEELLLHQSNDHRGSSILCHLCLKKFNSIGYLKMHIIMFHPDSGYTSNSKCHICHKQFSNMKNIRRHLKNVHKANDDGDELEINLLESEDDCGSENNYTTDVEEHLSVELTNELKMIDDIECKNNEINSAEEQDVIKQGSLNIVEPMHSIMIRENFELNNIKMEDLEEEDTFGDKVDYSHKAKCIFSIETTESNSMEGCRNTDVERMRYKKHFTKYKSNRPLSNIISANTMLENDVNVSNEDENNVDNMSYNDSMYDPKSDQSPSSCSSTWKIDKVNQRDSTDRKTYICDDCDKKFVDKSQYEKHLNTNHYERKHKCKVCNKSFSRKSNLKEHFVVHGEKQTNVKDTHPCKSCDKKFFDFNELLYHQSSDHKGNAIMCQFCCKEFKSIGFLKIHITRIHPESGYESDVKCHICHKQFSNRKNIRRHLKTIHNIEVNDDADEPEADELTETEEKETKESNRNSLYKRHLISESNLNERSILNDELKSTIMANNEKIDITDEENYNAANINDDSTYDQKNDDTQSSCSSTYKDDGKVNKFISSDEQTYLCDDCDKTFVNKSQYEKHLNTNHYVRRHTCNVCNKSFSRKSNLKEHFVVHEEKQTNVNASHPCEICDKKFSDFDKLLYHQSYDHKGSAIICQFCSKKFKGVGFLKIHIARVHPESGYESNVKCHICHKQFSNRKNIRRHLKTIHNIEVNDDADELERHELTETEEYNMMKQSLSKIAVVKSMKPSVSKTFFCEDCKESFPNKTQYQKHFLTQHKDKRHACTICNMPFSRKIDLMEHLHVHGQQQFSCRECAEMFNTRDELHAHKKSEGHNKTLLCTECGQRFISKATLIIHMRRHTGERPYKCKFCNKGFPCPDTVRKHERYHTDERNHVCETCGKGFQRKGHLIVHLRVHTGEKPYKCSHCPQAFTQSNDLKLHIRRHTGERLRCEFCDAAFLQAYKLRQHKLTEHGIKEEPPTQRVAKFTTTLVKVNKE